MILALWHRWMTGRNPLWLLLALGVLVVDVFVGSWLVTQELRLLQEVIR